MRAHQKSSSATENVSRETFSTMNEYVELLLKWNAKINLIGPATQSDIWSRHIEDSLQLVPLLSAHAKTLVDLGSGAGLPGLVIAIQCPELAVTLVEQDQRKAAFLSEVKHRLHLSNVTVVATDIAEVRGQYDVVTARALTALDGLLGMADRLMGEGGLAIFPKGKTAAVELEKAHQHWAFDATIKTSKTLEASSIITISKLSSKSHRNR